MKTFLGILGRYLLVWLVNVLALLLATSILPGFRFDTAVPGWWVVLLVLPIELAFLLILLRPIFLLLTLPLNGLTMGVPTLFFNGIILELAARMHPAFIIADYGQALVGALVLTVVSISVVGWLGLDEAYPLYQELLFRIARSFGTRPAKKPSRGVLLLQVDGLSRTSLVRAMERGRMPSVSGMLARGSHRLHAWNCGIPSNTPAVQSALLYGSRSDVPGFRWYDRRADRVRVVSKPGDLRIVEERATKKGTPLLAGGSCINSFLSGGAVKRLLTVSALGDRGATGGGEQTDFNLFFVSPYAYPKAVLASLWDFFAGMTQAILGRLFSDRPRLGFSAKRLGQRSIANAFLRETAFFWIKQDMVRGVPVIYSNFVGYDDVAHYSDPDAYDAQVSLANFDRMLRRLRRLAKGRRGIAYDVVLLSDHGQTPSIPFKSLFGRSLEKEIADLAGDPVTGQGSDAAASFITTFLAQMERTPAGRLGWAADRGRATLTRLSRRADTEAVRIQPTSTGDREKRPESAVGIAAETAQDTAGAERRIIVCVSGSLAHFYIAPAQTALTLETVRQEYPGLVERLARHPGIAFVAAAREAGDAVAIGRHGIRNLISGQVVGDADPLAPFGDSGSWSSELAELLSYPSSGDLVIQGAWWPEKDRVVVFEGQTSSHGGMGGRQTEAFLVVPTIWSTRPDDLRDPEALHRHFLAHIQSYREA